MSEVKKAFDQLLNALAKDIEDKFTRLEQKADENRLARLKRDLETLNEQQKNTKA